MIKLSISQHTVRCTLYTVQYICMCVCTLHTWFQLWRSPYNWLIYYYYYYYFLYLICHYFSFWIFEFNDCISTVYFWLPSRNLHLIFIPCQSHSNCCYYCSVAVVLFFSWLLLLLLIFFRHLILSFRLLHSQLNIFVSVAVRNVIHCNDKIFSNRLYLGYGIVLADEMTICICRILRWNAIFTFNNFALINV